MFFEASKEIKVRARELRQEMTEAEKCLWKELRNRNLEGNKFRRQHPINIYIADFYCHAKRLVVEVDGGIHKRRENREYDENRTTDLERFGIQVLRFTNEEVLEQTDKVLYKIKEECEKND